MNVTQHDCLKRINTNNKHRKTCELNFVVKRVALIAGNKLSDAKLISEIMWDVSFVNENSISLQT